MTRYRVDVRGHGAVRRAADLLPQADRRADWRLVRALFHQQVQLVDSGSKRIPDEVTEAFADAIGRISASYAGHEAELCKHALAVFAGVECAQILDLGLFRSYYEDERFTSTCGVTPTSRRRRVACRNTGTSELLIGSTSYGRFYNIRGNCYGDAASDLDFIIVIEQGTALDGIVTTLAALPGVTTPDVDHLADADKLLCPAHR